MTTAQQSKQLCERMRERLWCGLADQLLQFRLSAQLYNYVGQYRIRTLNVHLSRLAWAYQQATATTSRAREA